MPLGRSALYTLSLILSETLGGKYFYPHFIGTQSDLAKATQFINDRIELRMASRTCVLPIHHLVFEGTMCPVNCYILRACYIQGICRALYVAGPQ